jgi:hypothetical protein
VWLGGALFKGWAAGFIGSVVIGTIVALVSFVAGGDMVVMVEILTVAVVAVNVLKNKL